MEKTEENIIWQDVQKEQRKVSPSEDRVYDSLYEELKEKCSPSNYMSPYNREKVDVANALYRELMNIGKDETEKLTNLRRKATSKLNISFSTAKLYRELKDYCNPSSYMNPYDAEALKRANNYYALIEEEKNSIEDLEILKREVYQDEYLNKYQQDNKKGINDYEESSYIMSFIIWMVVSVSIMVILYYIMQNYIVSNYIM